MSYKICPSCKKKVNEMDTICPKCGTLFFEEPIEISSEDIINSETELEKNLENDLEKKEVITNKIKKKIIRLFDGFKKKFSHLFKIIKKYLAKFCRVTRLYKLAPYITYVNVLAIVTLIGTICLVGTGIKIVKYKDNSSTLSQVTTDTSYAEIKDKQEKKKKEGERSLDLERGLVILTYKNEKIGGVSTTLRYEMTPGEDVLVRTVILFKHNESDVMKMKHYLEVNYGVGQKQENGTLAYTGKDNSYTFTNGTAAEIETVEITPLD